MLRGLLQRAVRRLDEVLGDPVSDPGDYSIAPARPSPPTSSTLEPLEVLSRDIPGYESEGDRHARLLAERDAEIGRLRRQAQEQWTVILRFERQRDQWRELYKEKTKGYQTHVSKLNDTLAAERQMLVRALLTVNLYRKKEEKPPVDSRHLDEALERIDPTRPELQSARVFYEELKRAYEDMPVPLRRADFSPPVIDPTAPAQCDPTPVERSRL